MSNKPFDQQLYNENDPKGREVVRNFIELRGYTVIDNPDEYHADLIAKKRDVEYLLEVERRDKEHWDVKFQYKTVTIPKRKEKFTDKEFAYIIVRYDGKEIGILSREKVKKYFTEEYVIYKNTKYQSNESFFDIPTNEFVFISII